MTLPPSVALLGSDSSQRGALRRSLARRALDAGVPVTIADDALQGAGTLHLLLEPRHALWRQRLDDAGLPYSVLYGDQAAQCAAAWNLLAPQLGLPSGERLGDTGTARAAWSWRCDKCSDPACEHRLFRDLVAARDAHEEKAP